MKRVKVIVSYRSQYGGSWIVKYPAAFECCGPMSFLIRAEAIREARKTCRVRWIWDRIPSELIIKNKNGKFSSEGSTYGRDPRKTKG